MHTSTRIQFLVQTFKIIFLKFQSHAGIFFTLQGVSRFSSDRFIGNRYKFGTGFGSIRFGAHFGLTPNLVRFGAAFARIRNRIWFGPGPMSGQSGSFRLSSVRFGVGFARIRNGFRFGSKTIPVWFGLNRWLGFGTDWFGLIWNRFRRRSVRFGTAVLGRFRFAPEPILVWFGTDLGLVWFSSVRFGLV